MDLLAKSNGTTMARHIYDVVCCLKVLQEHNFAQAVPAWWEDLIYAALYHDLGKIDPGIQQVLRRSYPRKTFPHSLLSLLLFNADHCCYPEEVIAAVAFHHWRDYFPDYLMGLGSNEISRKAAELYDSMEEWDGYLEELKSELNHMFPKYDLESIQVNAGLADYLRWNSLADSGVLLPPYTLNFVPDYLARVLTQRKEREKLRVFMAGTLMRADHFASLIEDHEGMSHKDVELGPLPTYSVMRGVMENRFTDFWQGHFFVKYPKKRSQDLLFIGGTGVGKTEFAYLWSAGYKTFIMMPMRVAVNKQWDRATDLLRAAGLKFPHQIGLLHGNANLDIRDRINIKYTTTTPDSEENTHDSSDYTPGRASAMNDGEATRAVMLARHLASPLIIATADQIAPVALRYPGYERIMACLMGACLVVDEIQAFDPKAAAIVTASLELNHFFGGRNLVMTATLPPFIRKRLESSLGLNPCQIVNLYESEMPALGSSSRHSIRFAYHSEYDEELMEEMVEHCLNGKRVLIVVNTVNTAQALYTKLHEKIEANRTLLLHSRFTAADRLKQENLVTSEAYLLNRDGSATSGCIVVATQVVEASLDINADILYTDPAPADSLVQRMGRINRHLSRSPNSTAPSEANVVILLPRVSKKRKKASASITSIRSAPYDRDLVAVSLALLASFAQDGYRFSDGYEEIRGKWSACFRARAKDKLDKPNQNLQEKLADIPTVFAISEHQKQLWVEQSFEALTEANNHSELYLGKYLQDYEETLDILRHGYCSNSRSEAERLFRQIYDFEAIPEKLHAELVCEIKQWVEKNSENSGLHSSYADFVHHVLSKYLVSCPRHFFGESAHLDLSEEISCLPLGNKDKGRLERWTEGLRIINRPYDNRLGLITYK